MNIVRFFWGEKAAGSLSNNSIEAGEEDLSERCALRVLQAAPSSSGLLLTDKVITTTPSETIFYFLLQKHKTAKTQKDFTFTSYLTFEDLQLFEVHTKQKMQSEYVSLLNKLNRSLEHAELANSLKKLLLLLFYEIDPSVTNDQGKTFPELVANLQNSSKTSEDNKKLLGEVYTKYLLVSET